MNIEADFNSQFKVKNLTLIQVKGKKIPIFFVHGDRLNKFLPDYLGKDQPYYAFIHQGKDGQPFKYYSVEEIANHYLSELLCVQSEGPYVLCGYSFGGLVAYEMASRLINRGSKVKLLILIDTSFAQVNIRKKKLTLYIILRKIFYGLPKRIIDKIIKRTICKLFINFNRPIPVGLRNNYILNIYGKSYRKYFPKPIDCSILFFKAEKSDYLNSDEGWKDLCNGDIQIYAIPGNHLNIISDNKNFTLLAEKIKYHLDKIN